MRRLLGAAMLIAAATPIMAVDIGAVITIGQPGYYGPLNIGGYPRPVVVYRQPVVVNRQPVERPPVYMRVPPGHAKHWSKHCGEYNACGDRVLFVKDRWYKQQYVPRYQARQSGPAGYGHDAHDDDHRGDGDRQGPKGHSQKSRGHR